MRNVILTDIRYRMAVVAIRGLAKKDIRVTAVEFDDTPVNERLGFLSEYTYDKKLVPNAARYPKQFIEAIIKIANKINSNKKPVFIPVGMDSMKAAIKYKELLKPYVLFLLPNEEQLDKTNDTGKLLEVAKRCCIEVPKTYIFNNDETDEEILKCLKFPVVIKYREGELLKLKPDQRYKIIKDSDKFLKEYKRMHAIQEYPLVQEYIQGIGCGVSVVMDKNSNPISVFCHKRIREFPVSGGPSCLAESYWDKQMVYQAVSLLKELNFTGIAMVEFKKDFYGNNVLMEINPRFWGSMPLSVLSGCNMPYFLYRAICNVDNEQALIKKDILEKPFYRVGQKMRYMAQDLLSFVGYVKISKNKVKFVIYYIASWFNPKTKEGLYWPDDTKPFYRYIKNLIKKFFSKS